MRHSDSKNGGKTTELISNAPQAEKQQGYADYWGGKVSNKQKGGLAEAFSDADSQLPR